MKIYFLAKCPDATSYFRIDLPARALQAAGHEIKVDYLEPQPHLQGSGGKLESVAWADLIVVQRPTSPQALHAIALIKRDYPYKPIIGDYDDDYFSVPAWNPGYGFIKANESTWRKMVREFDAIMVSTDALEAAFRKNKRYCGPIEVIPNGFDFAMFDALEEPKDFALQASQVDPTDMSLRAAYTISNRQFNELMRDRPVIAWAGSRYHYTDLEWLAREMKDICVAIPEAVFLFVGFVQGNVVKDVPLSRLFTHGGAFPISAFYQVLKSLKIDISLAPLHPIEFNGAKSNLKAMEAFALGTYPICSEFEPYEDDFVLPDDDDLILADCNGHLAALFKHRAMGTLVPYRDKPGAWREAIVDAVHKLKDPSHKAAVMKHNHDYVRRTHDISQRTKHYEAFFTRIFKDKA